MAATRDADECMQAFVDKQAAVSDLNDDDALLRFLMDSVPPAPIARKMESCTAIDNTAAFSDDPLVTRLLEAIQLAPSPMNEPALSTNDDTPSTAAAALERLIMAPASAIPPTDTVTPTANRKKRGRASAARASLAADGIQIAVDDPVPATAILAEPPLLLTPSPSKLKRRRTSLAVPLSQSRWKSGSARSRPNIGQTPTAHESAKECVTTMHALLDTIQELRASQPENFDHELAEDNGSSTEPNWSTHFMAVDVAGGEGKIAVLQPRTMMRLLELLQTMVRSRKVGELSGDELLLLRDLATEYLQSVEDCNLANGLDRMLLEQNGDEADISSSTAMTTCLVILNRVLGASAACQLAVNLLAHAPSPADAAATTTAHILSEEHVASVLQCIRDQLANTLIFAIDAACPSLADGAVASSEGRRRIWADVLGAAHGDKMKRTLSDVVSSLGAFYRLLYDVLGTNAYLFGTTDRTIIPLFYLALAPMETTAPTETDPLGPIASLYAHLVYWSSNLLRWLFGRFDAHRSFVLDELLAYAVRLPSIRMAVGGKVQSHAVGLGHAWGGSLKRGSYLLSNGDAVCLWSAVVVNLVQGCAESCVLLLDEVIPSEGSLGIDDALIKRLEGAATEVSVLEKYHEESKICSASAVRCVMQLVGFIVKRCMQRVPASMDGAGDSSSTAASEYRMVLDGFVSDLITMLGQPEWPAASYILLAVVRVLLDYFERKPDQPVADKNAGHAKTVAMEVLGFIAVAVRKNRMALADLLDKPDAFGPGLRVSADLLRDMSSLEQMVMSDRRPAVIGFLRQCQSAVGEYLQSQSVDDPSAVAAQCYWLVDLVYVMTSSVLSSAESQITVPEEVSTAITEFIRNLCSKQRNLKHADDLLSPSTHRFKAGGKITSAEWDRDQIANLSSLLAQRCPLFSPLIFDNILGRVLQQTNSTHAHIRAKALRIFTSIISTDPMILGDENVRQAIQCRIVDASSSVRDAAIELVAKYVVSGPRELKDAYYPAISSRALDLGPNVRKRVVRFLRDVYLRLDFDCSEETSGGVNGSDDHQRAVDISVKLMRRALGDEESSIRDLAMRELEQCWFTLPANIAQPDISSLDEEHELPTSLALKDMSEETTATVATAMEHCVSGVRWDAAERKQVQARLSVVLACMRLSPTMVSNVLENLLHAHTGTRLLRIFALLKLFARESLAILHSKTLVAGIAPDDAIHFVSIVAQVCPLLVLDHIALFRKMFIDATAQGITGEAAAFTASRLISIFAAVLPLFGCANVTVESYTCGKYGLDPMFVRDLELRLMDMTLKLSQEAAGGAVKCLCAVVRSLTKKHWNIIRLLDKCMEYLETQTKAYATSDDSSMPLLSQKTALSIQRALLIVGLLVKHYTFEEGADALIADVLPDAPVAQVALAEKYRGVDVVQAVFDLLMQYALPTVAAFSASDVQTAGIEAVGCLFLSHPRYLLHDKSIALLDAILKPSVPSSANAASQLDIQMHMIGILVSYLDADEKRMQKRQDKQKDDAHRPDLKTLKGQTEEIAEGGISSSLMQHYLQPVLELTMHSDAQARVMAFDMLSRVISQGLVHPLQCIPYLIALETDSDVNLRNHALKVHSDLHDKYASFIHNKNMEGVRMAYHYQRMLRGGELAVVGMTGNGLAAEGDQTISPPSSALLHPLYEVVRDKRALRKELVQSLARLFDLQDGAAALSGNAIEEVYFLRFVAENLALLDFKSMEEPLTVISYLHRVVSVTGMDILQKFQNIKSAEDMHASDLSWIGLACVASAVVAVAVILKKHLQRVYALSDAKCEAYNPVLRGAKAQEKAAVRKVNEYISWAPIPLLSNSAALNAIVIGDMAQNDVTAGILREHMDAYAALLESVSTADNTAGDWSEYPSSAEPTPGQSAKKRVPTLATGKKRRGKAASTKHSKQNDESSTTATDTEVSDADAASESRETPSKMAPPSAVANKKKSRSKKAVRGNVQAELPTPDATLIVKRRENRRSVASARVNYDERSSDDMEAYEAEQVIQ